MLTSARTALDSGEPAEAPSRELLLFCHGFCGALTGHHEDEDRELFPELVAEHPELRETVELLTQDHALLAQLIARVEAAMTASAPPAGLALHLAGIAAIMENHFAYEERKLLPVLDEAGPDG